MRKQQRALLFLVAAGLSLAGFESAEGQTPTAVVKQSENRPLQSLRQVAAAHRAVAGRQFPRVIPNKILKESLRTVESTSESASASTQTAQGAATTNVVTSFDGASNADNGSVLGFMVAPPDTDGDVGPNHFVQMINLITTIYDKNGGVVDGPFASSAFWAGSGGLCEPFNQGDPIVVYDEANDRWLVSQFAFNDAFTQFAQCVAISQSGDPTAGYNRYEFDFDDIGFPDYPKHGIVSESVTMMANIFKPRGPFNFQFAGTFIGAMDKNAMYAGQSASLVGSTLKNEFGFVAGDLDDLPGSADVPAVFATAMSNSGLFDVWEIDVDWNNPNAASTGKVAAIPISPFDADLCSASREACIPQPGTTQKLEVISDRLMHRLQIRDFGSYKTMVAAHTVDVGGGVAGIRWYEMRQGLVGAWQLYQEGTFALNDGLHRWMPSIAMNASGDIGLGYLASNGVATHMSSVVTGQTAINSGSGQLDAAEAFCVLGTGSQTGTARSGDYSATSVDPNSDTFWHTNEYGPGSGGSFVWATNVCEFAISGGTPTAPTAPSGLAANAISSSEIEITFTDNSGNETRFELERSPNDDQNFSFLTNLDPNDTHHIDSGLGELSTYFYRARAVNDVGPSGYSNAEGATTLTSGPVTTMHVELIETGTDNIGRGTKEGFAIATIRDEAGQSVSGAAVSGTFSGTFNESGSGNTGGDGTVKINTAANARGGVTVNFCVDDVIHATLAYEPAGNGAATYDCQAGAGKRAIDSAQLDVPAGYALAQNYPNPFNPVTAIGYTIPESGHVKLRVYNVLGEIVATLVDGFQSEGSQHVRFDATGHSTGIYVYTIEAGDFVQSRRMLLLK